jgi:drug/metabolite transporter (DMT)-like permease
MHLTTQHLATITLLALAIMAFAGNSLLARAALADGQIGPGSFTALRLAAGAVILLPWFLRGVRERPNWRGALALFLYCGAFSFAYVELNAATGAMVLFAAVQATIMVASVLTGNRLRAIDVGGVMLAMAGVAILLGANAAPGPIMATLSMIIAGVAWGLYSVMGRSTADPARRTAGNFLLAALFSIPLPLLDTGFDVTAHGMVLAIASGAITSGLGYVAWYKVIPRLPPVTVGAAQLATPVVATLAAAALLSEPLTLRLAAAALLIVGGIAVTFRRA